MLRRAKIAFEVSLVAGIVGYSGIFHLTAGFGRLVCLVFGALALLSLLFSLFEDAAQDPFPRKELEPRDADLGIGALPSRATLAGLWLKPEHDKP